MSRQQQIPRLGDASSASTSQESILEDAARRPVRPGRATSISSHVEAVKPHPRRAPPSGLLLSNGLLHPEHMVEPGEEGYRTPTGDEIEQARHLKSINDVLTRQRNRSSQVVLDVLDGETEDPRTFSSERRRRVGHRQAGYIQKMRSRAHDFEHRLVLDWRQRLKHFTWTYFTITMATGGLASVLYHIPFRFPGLYALGCVLFLLNIVLFVINVACIALRFHLHPGTFRNSILHPTESLFIPAATVSFGTILMNISQYAFGHVGDWVNTVVMVLFWVDLGLAVIASFGVYLLMWSTQSFTIATMTPVWIFPAYPLLILGPHAGVLSSILSPDRSARVLIGGFTAQGIGMMVSLMIYSAYIYRLMTQKLPRDALKPGMFVSVGPSAFTASALINMSKNAMRIYGDTDFMGDGRLAAMIMIVVANWAALWFWGLACWFFLISVGAHYNVFFKGEKVPFAMTWFSYIFPQTALVNATFAVAHSFSMYPLQVFGCAMAIALVCMWVWVVCMMVRAIWLKQILWPQKGEDKDEGGFKGGAMREEKHVATGTDAAAAAAGFSRKSAVEV